MTVNLTAVLHIFYCRNKVSKVIGGYNYDVHSEITCYMTTGVSHHHQGRMTQCTYYFILTKQLADGEGHQLLVVRAISFTGYSTYVHFVSDETVYYQLEVT